MSSKGNGNVPASLATQSEPTAVAILAVAIKKEESEEIGLRRRLIATRDIRQGEIFLKERTLISGPSDVWKCQFESFAEDKKPICLSCYNSVKTGYLCIRCRWAVCNADCAKNPRHADFECKIFTEAKITPLNHVGNNGNIYECIFFLRCLLLSDIDPDKWKTIKKLESHVENQKKENKLSEDSFSEICSTATKFIREVCGLKHFNDKYIEFVAQLTRICSFGTEDVLDVRPDSTFRSGSFLYERLSLAVKGCVPNTYWAIQVNPDIIHFRASVDIKQGEFITVSFSNPSLATQERRKDLISKYGIVCFCSRCLDPTELNTFMSAVKCPSCSAGYLTPLTPLDDMSDWKCNNVNQCSEVTNQEFVNIALTPIRKARSFVSSQKNPLRQDSLLKPEERDVIRLEKLVHRYQGTVVHINHFLIHLSEYDIVKKGYFISMNTPGWSSENTDRFVMYARNVLARADILCPGLSEFRGIVLYFLQLGVVYQLQLSEIESVTETSGEKDENIAALKKQYKEMTALRKEASGIFSLHPTGVGKRDMMEFMRPNNPFIDQLNYLND